MCAVCDTMLTFAYLLCVRQMRNLYKCIECGHRTLCCLQCDGIGLSLSLTPPLLFCCDVFLWANLI